MMGEPSDLVGLRILVVEDVLLMAEVISSQLRGARRQPCGRAELSGGGNSTRAPRALRHRPRQRRGILAPGLGKPFRFQELIDVMTAHMQARA
jgi:hypothetical protein